VPSFFSGVSAKDLLVNVARDAELTGRGAKGRQREETVAKAACTAAVKAHDKLTLDEIEALMVALAKTELPYTCPHGRPTLVHMSFREINRKFGRE
jgi:DNA mismatch repair protein MutL